MMRPILRGVVVWCGIIVVEVFHGIARTVFLAPLVGDFRDLTPCSRPSVADPQSTGLDQRET